MELRQLEVHLPRTTPPKPPQPCRDGDVAQPHEPI